MSPVDREDLAPAQQDEKHTSWKRWQIVLSVVLLGLLLYFFWQLFGQIKLRRPTAEWIWLW